MRCPRLILRWTICSTGLHDGGKLPAGATWPNPHGTEDRSMTVTDIATRTYNHNFRLDPIVRSLLDTDFYKLLMLQMIRHIHPDVEATFSVINRTRSVRLADIIDEEELRASSTMRGRSASPKRS